MRQATLQRELLYGSVRNLSGLEELVAAVRAAPKLLQAQQATERYRGSLAFCRDFCIKIGIAHAGAASTTLPETRRRITTALAQYDRRMVELTAAATPVSTPQMANLFGGATPLGTAVPSPHPLPSACASPLGALHSPPAMSSTKSVVVRTTVPSSAGAAHSPQLQLGCPSRGGDSSGRPPLAPRRPATTCTASCVAVLPGGLPTGSNPRQSIALSFLPPCASALGRPPLRPTPAPDLPGVFGVDYLTPSVAHVGSPLPVLDSDSGTPDSPASVTVFSATAPLLSPEVRHSTPGRVPRALMMPPARRSGGDSLHSIPALVSPLAA